MRSMLASAAGRRVPSNRCELDPQLVRQRVTGEEAPPELQHVGATRPPPARPPPWWPGSGPASRCRSRNPARGRLPAEVEQLDHRGQPGQARLGVRRALERAAEQGRLLLRAHEIGVGAGQVLLGGEPGHDVGHADRHSHPAAWRPGRPARGCAGGAPGGNASAGQGRSAGTSAGGIAGWALRGRCCGGHSGGGARGKGWSGALAELDRWQVSHHLAGYGHAADPGPGITRTRPIEDGSEHVRNPYREDASR